MPKGPSEDERISNLETALPALSTKLAQLSDSIDTRTRLRIPIAYSPLLGELNPLATSLLPNPLGGLFAELEFPRLPGDFEVTAARAGFLAILGQLTIGGLLPEIDAITTNVTTDDTRDPIRATIRGLASRVEEALKIGEDALKLAGAAASAGKKFGDALNDLEAAVTSFLEARKKLSELSTKLPTSRTSEEFAARKQELKEAAEKIDNDLNSVKAALTKVT